MRFKAGLLYNGTAFSHNCKYEDADCVCADNAQLTKQRQKSACSIVKAVQLWITSQTHVVDQCCARLQGK